MPTPDITIQRAIGVLMWRHNVDDNQAFRSLVDLSQAKGMMVVDAATDVLDHEAERERKDS